MIRSLLRSFFPILAIVGMLLAPVAASGGVGAMSAVAVTADAMAVVSATSDQIIMSSNTMMPGDMACCPQEKPSTPDCQKTCPLMGMCAAGLIQLGSTASAILPPLVAGKELFGWPSEALLAGLSSSPPVRPPRV